MYLPKPKQLLKLKALYARIDSRVIKLSIRGATSKEPVPFSQREVADFQTYSEGDDWGELFDCAWFNLQAKVPEEFLDANLYLKLDFNCELCLFNNEGVPVKGFTNKSSQFDRRLGGPTKRYFQLKEFISPDGTVNLWFDAGLNDLFGKLKKKGKIEIAEIVDRKRDLRTLYYDLETLLPIYPRKAGKALRLAFKEESIGQALEITSGLLKKSTTNNHQISSIGHSHVDLAWLWPIRETKRKAARTFATVLYLMDRYPDYKFGASQPQLYQWVKEDYPVLFDQIREKIAEGRWEVQGGMWVESDTNVPSGESLVRQMLYGIRYFQEEFGIRVRSLWLPDVFGYNGSLPQIIKKSGLDYFMTIKISWNLRNKFPHHSFIWKGVDGTGVLAHMPPEGNYNSPVTPFYIDKSQRKYREKEVCNHTLNLFGIGDGGGGPGAEHLERLQRIKDLDPLPKVRQEFSRDYFEDINHNIEKYPTYQGELYLEYHRGTYTSQSWSKYYNRKLEQKLKTVETMLVHLKKHANYKKDLELLWKEILLYQFHDILPGSSIKRVYDESIERYQKFDQQLDTILEEALGASLKNGLVGKGDSIYNPLPRHVKGLRLFNGGCIEFSALPFSDNTDFLNFYKEEIGYKSNFLENSLIRVTFKPDGRLASVFDKEIGQELLRSPGNALRIYRDSGNAWNIMPFYWRQIPAKPKLILTKYYRYGNINIIEQHYRYRKSSIVQKIMLHPGQKLLEFDTQLNWQESYRMLRTAFPLKLKTNHAVFDIQFGTLNRSTNNKTSIEKARWEVPGQKWVDMSNGTYGASVITDSKYGFRTKNNTIDLDMLRTTVNPGKKGDIGKHHFRYAFYVHSGDHNQGDVNWQATVFDTWFPIYTGSQLSESLLTISNEKVQYSTIKTAEDDGSVIIRLYETSGNQNPCTISLNGFGECEIKETNLVEEEGKILGQGSEIALNFAPFEIKTLKFIPN